MGQGKRQSLKEVSGRAPQERRITNQLLAFWNEARKDRPFPEENDIDPKALKDIWESCFLIHTYDIGKGSNYNYTFLGSNIMRAHSAEITRKDAPPLASPSADSLAALYDHVLATRRPLITEGIFPNAAGREIRYRQCLLPFGTGDTVTAIFGGMKCKVVESTAFEAASERGAPPSEKIGTVKRAYK